MEEREKEVEERERKGGGGRRRKKDKREGGGERGGKMNRQEFGRGKMNRRIKEVEGDEHPSLSTSPLSSPPPTSPSPSASISNLLSFLPFSPTLTCVLRGALRDQTASLKFLN